MFLKIGGQLHYFEGSLGGKKYLKVFKNAKTILKHDLCSMGWSCLPLKEPWKGIKDWWTLRFSNY